MSGAFQSSRELFSNPIWKNIVDFRLFFLIYGNAVFKEHRVSDDLTLNRGEWLRSTRKLQDDLEYIENRQLKKYSTSVINRCIKRLVDSQRVCTRMHELGTVFTVVNYEQYQDFDNYKKPNLERNLEQSGNSSGTVGEQSGNNNKKDKKEKKEKKVKEYSQNTIDLTDHLIYWMKTNNENARIPENLNSWNDEMDKLERLDKYEYMQIRSVIDWCQQDSFWKSCILSTTKLREKMGTLIMQMQRPQAKTKVSSFTRLQELAREEEDKEREASGHY